MRVTDHATLEKTAAIYREGGWPAEVEGDASSGQVKEKPLPFLDAEGEQGPPERAGVAGDVLNLTGRSGWDDTLERLQVAIELFVGMLRISLIGALAQRTSGLAHRHDPFAIPIQEDDVARLENLDAVLPRIEESGGPMLAQHVAIVQRVVVMAGIEDAIRASLAVGMTKSASWPRPRLARIHLALDRHTSRRIQPLEDCVDFPRDCGGHAIAGIAEGTQCWLSMFLRDALDNSGCEETEAISFEPGAQAWEGISSVGSNAVA